MRIKNRYEIFFLYNYINIKYSFSLNLKFHGVDVMEKLTLFFTYDTFSIICYSHEYI